MSASFTMKVFPLIVGIREASFFLASGSMKPEWKPVITDREIVHSFAAPMHSSSSVETTTASITARVSFITGVKWRAESKSWHRSEKEDLGIGTRVVSSSLAEMVEALFILAGFIFAIRVSRAAFLDFEEPRWSRMSYPSGRALS